MGVDGVEVVWVMCTVVLGRVMCGRVGGWVWWGWSGVMD